MAIVPLRIMHASYLVEGGPWKAWKLTLLLPQTGYTFLMMALSFQEGVLEAVCSSPCPSPPFSIFLNLPGCMLFRFRKIIA